MLIKRLFHHKNSLLSLGLFLSFGIFLTATLASFKTENSDNKQLTRTVKQQFISDLQKLTQQAAELRQSLQLLEQKQVPLAQVQEVFIETKKAYKRTEYLLEYMDPQLAKNLNGGPIPKVVIEDEDYLSLGLMEPKATTYPPEGLQVLEELLFADEVSPETVTEALVLSYKLEEKISLFANTHHTKILTGKHVLESLREEVLRVITMGISGFDAPAAGHEMKLAAIALQPVLATTQLYNASATGKAKAASTKAVQQLQLSVKYLQQNPDFDSFDRLYFIRELADPAYAALTELQQHLLQPTTAESKIISKPVNDFASSLFSEDFLQAAYYAKQDRKEQPQELVELGKTLFFDPVLSANNQRSCASCHAPEKAFTDGRARSIAFDFKGNVPRNSPTLLNAIYSKAYFWDSRTEYLQDQIPNVLTNPDELHGNYKETVQKLEQSSEYRRLFKRAFAGENNKEINTNTINRAIAAYVQSLTALNSPFDKFMRRETEILSASAKRGFNLFTGKAACATCHFAPVFNGTVPPRFLESEVEILGVPATAKLDNTTLDDDLGRGGIIKAEAWKHAFKTPTVRNAALTAPYMHNGVFDTLEELIEFYDLGGGAGIGLDVPNQTLPAAPLNLTPQEKQDLIAFLHSLTDTTSAASAPKYLPQFPVNAQLNERVVGGKY